MNAKCPSCDAEIPEDIPRKGDVTYTCPNGHELNGDGLRAASGMPVAEEAPKKRTRKK